MTAWRRIHLEIHNSGSINLLKTLAVSDPLMHFLQCAITELLPGSDLCVRHHPQRIHRIPAPLLAWDPSNAAGLINSLPKEKCPHNVEFNTAGIIISPTCASVRRVRPSNLMRRKTANSHALAVRLTPLIGFNMLWRHTSVFLTLMSTSKLNSNNRVYLWCSSLVWDQRSHSCKAGPPGWG